MLKMKKAMSLLLSIAMILPLFAGTGIVSFAEESDILSYLTYEINDGEVTISGCNNELSGAIVIPDKIEGYPVTTINNWAFDYCYNITEITLPASLKSIDTSTFSSCDSLERIFIGEKNEYYTSDENGILFNKDKTQIEFFPVNNPITEYVVPDTVTSLKNWQFENRHNLEKITVGNSVASIGDYAFAWSNNLKEVIFADGVTSIGMSIFDDCSSLIRVVLPNTLKRLEDGTFRGCSALTEFVIPEGVETIGAYAFDCRNLKSVFIPESVTTIEDSAFRGCTKLKDIYYGGDAASWDKITIDEPNDHIKFAEIHYNSDDQNITPDGNDRPAFEPQKQKWFNLPENDLQEINLPFDFEDVCAYNTQVERSVFLTIHNIEIEAVSEWEFSTTVTYRIYYTDDFVNFDFTEFVIDSEDYKDYSNSWILFSDDWYTERFNCNIYCLDDSGIYYFSIYITGGPHELMKIGFLFEDGNITYTDEKIAGTDLIFFDDRCIMVDFQTPAYVTAVEESDEVSEYGDPLYNVHIAPRYYYTEDFETWTEAYGPTDCYLTAWPPEVGSYYSYFYVNKNNGILTFRYRPEEEPCEVFGYEWHNVFATFDGKEYFELERAANSYFPLCYTNNTDSTFFELSSVCYTESDYTAFIQITQYDSEGNIIRTDKASENIDHYAYLHNLPVNDFIFSVNNDNEEFDYCIIYEYDENMNLTNYISELPIKEMTFGTNQFNTTLMVFLIYDNTLLAYNEVCETANLAQLPFTLYSTSAWNGNLLLFGEKSYLVPEEVIMNAINNSEDVEPPTKDPDIQDPADDENRLVVNTDSGITVYDEYKHVSVPLNSTCESVEEQITNENFIILDKDGNELADNALVGTGCKVQVKDIDGNVVNEYEIVVVYDVDGNGKVTAADARLTLRAAAKLDTLEDIYAEAANMDGNDKLTASDARLILRKAAFLE